VSADYPSPDVEDIDLVEVLRALGDPVRLKIVNRLRDGGAHCKTEEGWDLGVQKSTLSHHFRTLREAGVTETVPDGRVHWIRLRREELDSRFPGLLAGVLAAQPEPEVTPSE
jgi:DNA-binding transcriptional ArsR family regulator